MNPWLEPKLPITLRKNKITLLIGAILAAVPFLPWVAFTTGVGHVTAIDPNERIQNITAPVNGLISQWLVTEGQKVKKGDVIARIQDNDPDLVQRYQRELDAAKAATDSAKLMFDTSKLNLNRQRQLFDQGLSARKEYEKAKIETSKMEMEYSKSLAVLTKAETQISRQIQVITSPRDGTITRILPGEMGQLIKAGTSIAVLTPDISTLAVELWIDGNDTAMIEKGQKAVVQFEGWPSLQIAGWPSLAIGVFPAKVYLIDAASSYKGKFRVLLVPDGEWPSTKFLIPGSHSKGTITMAHSFILKEIWRQLTGLPPVTAPIKDELQRLLLPQKDKESEDKGTMDEEKK